MKSIFLSYARSDDGAFARRLHVDLTKAGFDVWFDRVSMPARQLPFPQEIRDAIAACDRVLLVVGPGVLTAEWATKEWRFAHFELGKCVNPIVRLDGRGADGGIIDGYELIPEDLKLLHAEDFRDDAQYDAHLANLIRQLSEPVPPVGKLVAVPELPACFLAQPDRIKALRDLLLIDLQKPVVVSGVAARVGLQGMGGIGKSVLASALAHRPEVRRAFPDGIFWITLGQKPQLAELQRWLARELGDEALFPDERSGKACLRNLFAGHKALLVLDDVWQREHAEAFNVIGAMGRILLTTRDAGLVTALASKETHYRVELPTEAEAEAIFAAAAHLELAALPAATREIVAQCGRLPLALALCGGMVRGGVSPADVLEALREHDLEFLSSDHPAEEQHQNAWKAMDVSLRVLPPEQRDRFAELAVFALDRGAPEAAVVTLWEHTGELSPRHARKLLADFAARSLVYLTAAAEGDQNCAQLTLHDLLHNFATGMAERQFGSLAALHQTLLDAYWKKCPSGWPSGPDDGYYLQNLCEHLLAARKLDDTVELLTDIPWIEAKCRAKLVFSLQDDYRNTIAVMPEAREGLRLERERQARLARWTDEITAYSRQWSERRDQLARGASVSEQEPHLPEPPPTCRVWSEEELQAEHQRLVENPTPSDRMEAFSRFVQQECYPLVEFGSRPGFVSQHAFNSGPAGPVHLAAVRGLPGVEAPLLLRHWFRKDQYNPRPALLKTLDGHSSFVRGVCVTPDGLRAVSASWDGTLRVWELATGRCLRVLEGHVDEVNSVSMTPDGLRAVSGSDDYKLRVWDLETGMCLRVLEGHTSGITSVSVTPDCRTAVSASYDKTLRVWDLAKGSCLRVPEEHPCKVNCVSVTADGLRAVSGGADKTLRVWDLETGQCLRVLEGHTGEIYSVSATPDGRLAVSSSLDRTLRVWDTETGACIQTIEGKAAGMMSVSVTPDGRQAVSGRAVWDLVTGICLLKLEGHSGGVDSVSVTPDGRRAVTGSNDNALRVWDLESGTSTLGAEEISPWLWVTCVSKIHDGRIVRSGSYDNTLRVWDMDSGDCFCKMEGHRGRVTSICVTPDGRRAISGSEDKTLRMWNVESGDCLGVLEGHRDRVTCVCLTSDGRCAVSGSSDNTLRVWDMNGMTCIRTIESAGFVGCVCSTPEGHRVVSTSGGKLRVWDLESGACLREIDTDNITASCVSVAPDGRRVVFEGAEFALRVWNLETGALLQKLKGHRNSVLSVSISADGRLGISGGQDNTLRIWDMESGACVAQFATFAAVSAIASSHGNITVGTGSGQVLLLELRNLAVGPLVRSDLSEEGYEALLRRGLDQIARARGSDHEEAVAHIAALAAHLERAGRVNEASHLRQEHDTLSPLAASRKERERKESEIRGEPILRRQAASLAYRSGDYAHAELLLRSLIAQDHDLSSTHCHLGRVLLLQDRFEDAAAETLAAWEHRKDSPAYVVPRILWMQLALSYILATEGTPTDAARVILGRMKTALSREGARSEWAMNPVLSHLRPRLSVEHYQLLNLLVNDLSDSESLLPAFELYPPLSGVQAEPLE